VFLVRVGQDIGSLDGLREEAEDVVDDEQSALCAGRTSLVGLHAINGDPFSLLLVALGDHRRNGTAGVGLHTGSFSSLDM